MTAGRGIVHSEMPVITDGDLWGFQLWVNLPAKDKMIKPRYQDYQASDIPSVKSSTGCTVRVMAGEFEGHPGARSLRAIVTDPKLCASVWWHCQLQDVPSMLLCPVTCR